MPLFLFKCESCGREFEELLKDSVDMRDCPDCGNSAKRKIDVSFGINTKLNPRHDTIYSSKEIDKVVGEAANKSWEGYDKRWESYYKKRRELRRKDKDIKEIAINPKEGSLIEHLGTRKEQEFRKEYGKQYRKQITEKNKDDNTPVVMKKIL